ncbi:MAG: carbonic anhydrase [Victivallales bacterium]|nr:carbonic anhydrase [Victivallales bacterium]
MQDIARMIRGFRHFRRNYFSNDARLFERLKEGQNPRTLVIGCCDSRVDPALLTESAPGDLFVIRNVANLVPPYDHDTGFHGVSSGIEYAVKALEVRDIVVLGHSGCGGIAALLDHAMLEQTEYLRPWLSIAQPALNAVREELQHKPRELQCRAGEEAALLVSLENLLSFPWIRERVEAGQLTVHGWYFDLHRGELLAFDPEQREFVHLA